jgi:hypothetical protein
MEVTLGAFQTPTNVPQSWFEPRVGYPFMASLQILRSTDITLTERKFCLAGLVTQVARSGRRVAAAVAQANPLL